MATALLREQDSLPTKGRARVEALLGLSARAVRAERFVEWAKPAPTLPKRMGSVATDDGSRSPIAPTLIACDDTAYAEFIEPAPASATDAKPASPERKKK